MPDHDVLIGGLILALGRDAVHPVRQGDGPEQGRKPVGQAVAGLHVPKAGAGGGQLLLGEILQPGHRPVLVPQLAGQGVHPGDGDVRVQLRPLRQEGQRLRAGQEAAEGLGRLIPDQVQGGHRRQQGVVGVVDLPVEAQHLPEAGGIPVASVQLRPVPIVRDEQVARAQMVRKAHAGNDVVRVQNVFHGHLPGVLPGLLRHRGRGEAKAGHALPGDAAFDQIVDKNLRHRGALAVPADPQAEGAGRAAHIGQDQSQRQLGQAHFPGGFRKVDPPAGRHELVGQLGKAPVIAVFRADAQVRDPVEQALARALEADGDHGLGPAAAGHHDGLAGAGVLVLLALKAQVLGDRVPHGHAHVRQRLPHAAAQPLQGGGGRPVQGAAGQQVAVRQDGKIPPPGALPGGGVHRIGGGGQLQRKAGRASGKALRLFPVWPENRGDVRQVDLGNGSGNVHQTVSSASVTIQTPEIERSLPFNEGGDQGDSP